MCDDPHRCQETVSKGPSTFISCLTPQRSLPGPQHQPPALLILTLNRSSLPTKSPEPEPTSESKTGPEPSVSTPTCRKKRNSHREIQAQVSIDSHAVSRAPIFCSLNMSSLLPFPAGVLPQSPHHSACRWPGLSILLIPSDSSPGNSLVSRWPPV